MQILKKGTDIYLWRNIQLKRSRLVLFGALFILATTLFIMNEYPYASIGLIMIPLSYILGVYSYSQYMTWSSGIMGEDAVTRELEALDDRYSLINGVVIPPNRGDTDHIVLGPNGIFVIESKHYGGEVYCNSDSWMRRKVSRRGTPYKLKTGSPSNQVKRNAKVLKDFILKHKSYVFNGRNPHVWINVIVVFTNENVELILKEPTVTLLEVDALSEHIENTKGNIRLSRDEIARIGDVILNRRHHIPNMPPKNEVRA